MSLPRLLAVLKEEGLLCSIGMLSSRTVRQLRFVEESLHLPRAAPSLVTFPLPLETVPRDAGQLHFSKAFPHYFRAHSSKCDPIPLKLRIPDDFVAPGPCKTGFFPYKKTKQHFFFSHPEVLKNYLLTIKNTCYELKERWIFLGSTWESVLRCIGSIVKEKLMQLQSSLCLTDDCTCAVIYSLSKDVLSSLSIKMRQIAASENMMYDVALKLLGN